MVNIVRTRRNSMGGSSSPRAAEVGEIDTKAPFQSVKAALSLFGVASSSSPKAKPVFTKKAKPQAQAVLDKEARFHLALNELNKLKEQVRGTESQKKQTLPELDKAQRTLDDLQERLRTVNESKQSILETSEALKERARKLEEAISSTDIKPQQEDVNTSREEYRVAILELDAAKQQLSNVHREYDSTLEAKATASRLSLEADAAAEAHRLRVANLTKQIATMQEALGKIKSSSKEAEQDHQKLLTRKHEELSSRRLAKQELENKLLALQNEHHSLLADDLQAKLAETNAEISFLEEKVSTARAAHSESQKAELEVAKKSLEQVAEEKISLQISVESLKQELEHVGKELLEQKFKQEESEALVNKLKAELDDKKNVLEAGLVNKTSAADVSDDMAVSMEQLILETEKAKQEAEMIKRRIEKEQKETKTTLEMVAEMENKLTTLLQEVEEAKVAERAAQDKMKAFSERTDDGVAANEESTSESNGNGKIKLSTEDYNSLIEKVDESENLADIKVTANIAQVEALVASQKEAAQRYEAISKEIEELKMKEEEALKTAEMAEAAKSVLEAELHRRYQQEQINQTPQVELTVESNT